MKKNPLTRYRGKILIGRIICVLIVLIVAGSLPIAVRAATPVANPDPDTVNEDSSVISNVLLNDTGLEDGISSVTISSDPTDGSAGVNVDNTITYTPDDDFFGEDSYEYEVCDIDIECSTATVTITINPVNDPPSFTKGTDQTVNEDVLLQTVNNWATDISKGPPNESDQTLTFQVSNDNTALFSSQPDIDSAGTLTYTPANNVNGSALITISLQDSGGGDDTYGPETFTITVNPVNDPPFFNKGTDQTVNEDAGAQSVVGWATGISPGPSDESAQTLTFQVSNDNTALFSSQPDIDSAGTLTYTPANNANGSALVTISLQDSGGGDDTYGPETFTITVNPVNDPPFFNQGTDQTVNEDAGAQSVAGWATGISPGPSDESAQTLTFQVSNDNTALFSSQPDIDSAGTLTYTPANNANGSALVTVSLQDSGGGDDTYGPETFTITVNPVNDPPFFNKGTDQTVNEDAGAQSVAGWATGMSAGPVNESGQSLTSFLVSNDNNALFSSQPAIDVATGDLTYTPANNANGSALVTVSLQDDGGTTNGGNNTSDPQTFNITVNPVNDPPSFTKGTDQTVNEDAGAQSVAGWATAISPGPSNESSQTLTFQVSNDNTALFSSQPVFDATTGDLTYTPANNANGSTQVTVSLQDNGGTDNGGVDTSDLQYFNITVNPVNDPPVVTDFSKNGNEDSDIAFSASDFVNSFSDIDGDTLVKIQVTSLSISGTLKLNGAPVTLNQEIVYADLGGLTFTPKLNWHGTTSIGWNASDGNAYATIDALITITIQTVNDPPVADDDTYSTLEDKELIVDAKHGVLKSDVDPDGDNLTARLINNSVSNGTVNLDPDGSFRYIPEPNFNGPANFKYVANDGQADSNVATVTIKVGIENDPPNAQDDTATTPEDTPVAINVIANDFDVDGDMDVNTLSVFNPPIFGSTEVVQSSGIIMYTPDLNIHGVDHFEYEICDTVEECATATVTVTVTSVNDPPVAIKDTYYINITTKPPLIVQPPGVLSNDSDNDVEDELNAILVTNVNNEKQFTFNPDGSFEYSPRSGFNGIDGFTYKAFDGVLYSAVTQVGIVVDTESPTVEWISPVDNGSVLSVNGEVITLSVNATDKLGIERVNFYRWDAENTIFVIIGDVYSEPFTHDLNTNELNTGWNQIFAVSFDIAGNVSERQHIWLMREIPVNNTIYLPIVHSK